MICDHANLFFADDLFNQELGEAAVTRGDILIGFEWINVDIENYDFDMNLSVRLPWIGVSIVDSSMHRELLYLSLSETVLDLELTNDWRDFGMWFSINEFQIDNPDVRSGSSDPSRMVILDSVREADDFPQVCVLSLTILVPSPSPPHLHWSCSRSFNSVYCRSTDLMPSTISRMLLC